jgi:DNA-binding LytR/AlgR family response regulator
LIRLIKQCQPDAEILQVLETVEDAVNWFAYNTVFDLVFMDIQLDDGLSFEIFNATKITAPIIFTTAYDEYAIRAFKVNSVDYLLKPIEKEALEHALLKYKSHFSEGNLETKITGIITQINTKYKTRFFIKVGMRFKSIPVENICCFYVQERNTFLKTNDGKNFDLDDSLDQLQKRINPDLFFRINRNYLVNINCIDEIVSYSANRLKLKIKHEVDLIVSRDKVSDFKHWMDR